MDPSGIRIVYNPRRGRNFAELEFENKVEMSARVAGNMGCAIRPFCCWGLSRTSFGGAARKDDLRRPAVRDVDSHVIREATIARGAVTDAEYVDVVEDTIWDDGEKSCVEYGVDAWSAVQRSTLREMVSSLFLPWIG